MVQQYLPWVIGVIAAILHATGYVIYNLQTKNGESKPNIVSWSIWAFMAALNALTFAEISSVAHALQYAVGTFAAIITFLLSLFWGKFAWPSRREIFVFLICLIAVVVWWNYKRASMANFIFIVAFIISFYPTFKGIYTDPMKEKSTPWWIWSAAFVVSIINNIFYWKGDVISIINPIILFVCHWSVAFLSRKTRQRKSTQISLH